jgi:hypothetical protein
MLNEPGKLCDYASVVKRPMGQGCTAVESLEDGHARNVAIDMGKSGSPQVLRNCKKFLFEEI